MPEPAKDSDLARLLVLDNLIFAAEAEARWLDLVEQRLSRRSDGDTRPASQGGTTP